MKVMLAAVAVFALAVAGPARAQSALDHRVQRTWDELFNPPPAGDPRTNWERRRDNEHAVDERRARGRQAAEYAEYCRYHPGGNGCGPAYRGRYDDRPYR